MNVRTKAGAILATMLLGAFTCLSGCATTGTERAAKTTSKMQTVESDMKQALVQVETTDASLETLIKPDQVGVKKAYDEYAENVNQMEKIQKQLDRHDTQMREQGKEYFTEWEKKGETYADPNLREASEERRAQLSEVFGKVPQASAGMKEALNSYVSQLKQIQSYLSTDLTPKGIEAMTPSAQKAMQEGQRVKDAVQPALSAMQRAMAELAQGNRGTAAGGMQKTP